MATSEKQLGAEGAAASARRKNLEGRENRDVTECLRKLWDNSDAVKTWASIQRVLSESTRSFFEDFQYVDVNDYRSAVMDQLPKGEIDASLVIENSVRQVARQQRGGGGIAIDTELVGKNLAYQETATIKRSLNNRGNSSFSNNIYKVDLPPPTRADRDAATSWSQTINGLDFQCGGLTKAMAICRMSDPEIKRIPHQSRGKTLRWWQVLFIWWATKVRTRGRTKGGLNADTFGLGKTWSYCGYILVDTIDCIEAYEEAPEDDRPECRPWMIQTLPGLIKQTVEALREFSDLFRIIVLHSDPSVIAGREIFVVSKIPNDHTIWDTRDRTNIRTIIVTSFNTATSQYGPTAFNARKLSQDAHWQVPKEQAWVNNPKGRVRGMILDEAHYGFRNETSFTETVKWFKPPVLWMFSGSPAPRGLQDWISYLSLIENDELAGKGEFPDDSCGYKPDEDPYLLDDSHPAVKYRYTAFAFRKWIVENKHISECEKVIKAQSVLKHFVLRRDYTAACPLGSDRTIARGLPPLHHYAVERLFSPTSQDLYNKFIKQWSRRLALKPNEGGFKHPIPNPRAVRAMTLITMVPILGYLHKANPEYRPPPKKDDEYYVPYAQKLIKKNANNDQDWLSRFNEDSTLWKSMPGVGKDLRRWRWILNTVISEGCTEIPRRNYQDTKGVLTKDVLHVILQHSPKIEALLSVVAEHALLRDNKIILWFSYPITQSLIVEILMSWKYTDAISDSLHSGTPQKRRDELQADMNSPNATIRILAASMHCRGVGLNLQKDSHVCMMFEAASTLDMELQVISRQHRLGQLYPVTVYSVVMLNTIDEKFVRKLLQRAVAGTAALLSYQGPTSEVTDEEESTDLSKYMEGCFVFMQQDGTKRTLHVRSETGMRAISELRQINGHADDWLPEILDPTTALQHLLAENRAHVVRQHGGMGKGATTDLDFLVAAELDYRRSPPKQTSGNPLDGKGTFDTTQDETQLPPTVPAKFNTPSKRRKSDRGSDKEEESERKPTKISKRDKGEA